ncbi:hypothetical protein DFH28DRAFT_859423, partial [Melampsora americana]
RPIELVQAGGILSKDAWDESQEVLKALHHSLSYTYSRRWMVWDNDIQLMLDKTAVYCQNVLAEPNAALKVRWQGLTSRISGQWANIVNGVPVMAEGLDEEDLEEHRLNWGE